MRTTITSILSRLSNAVSGTEKELYTEQELNNFAAFYLDKWDENTSEDVVAEAFMDYWWDTDHPCRRCSVCGKLMNEGYCEDMGAAYYCRTNAFTPNTPMRSGQPNAKATTRAITQSGNNQNFILWQI